MDRMMANPGGETFYPVNPVHPVKGFGAGGENVWPAGTPCEGTRPTAAFEGERRTFDFVLFAAISTVRFRLNLISAGSVVLSAGLVAKSK
jgi:hypothetical protein